MSATEAILDFREVDGPMPLTGSREPVSYGSLGGIIGRPITSKRDKQIRQRARRKMKAADDELAQLYGGRGIDEWDMEELARGRPRAKDGSFKGRTPGFIDRALHEQIVKRFEDIIKSDMNANAVGALKVLAKILDDEEIDEKGKPRTPAGVKLEASKFLIEHVIGKPKQRQEVDISVKLQSILGSSMVNPSANGGFELTQGYVEAEAWEEEDDVESND